jgi:hypothetical protein
MKFSWIDIGVPKKSHLKIGGGGGKGGFWFNVAKVVIIHNNIYVAKFGNIQIGKNWFIFFIKMISFSFGG